MSRLLLCVTVSWVVLGSPAVGRADDAEDKAAAFVEKLGGKVSRITKSADGSGYDCELTRAGKGEPVRLVAAASVAGKIALQRANGRESCAAPGFLEVGNTVSDLPRRSVRDDIARCFGAKE